MHGFSEGIGIARSIRRFGRPFVVGGALDADRHRASCLLRESHSTIQRDDLAEEWGCLFVVRITAPLVGSSRDRCGTALQGVWRKVQLSVGRRFMYFGTKS